MASGNLATQLLAGLKWLFKAIIAFLVLAAILLPFVLMMYMKDIGEVQSLPVDTAIAWLAVVSVLTSLFLLYLAWRIIRALFLHPFGSWKVFGATTSGRLVALGITTLIMPKAVWALIMAPVSFVLELVRRLPDQAARSVFTISGAGGNAMSIKDAMTQLIIMVRNMFADIGAAFDKTVSGVSIPDIVVALGLWAVAGHLLSSAVPSDNGTITGFEESRLVRYFKSISEKQRYGIILASVFLIAAYLSIAAIVAIPWLHEEQIPQGLSRENLEKMLNNILPTSSTQLEERLHGMPALDDDPLTPLSEALTQLSSRETEGETFMLSFLSQDVADSKAARNKAISQCRQMPAEIMNRAAQIRMTALNSFDVETATLMSNMERSYFIREIQRTVSSDYSVIENKFQECIAAVGSADTQFRAIAQQGAALLASHAAGEGSDMTQERGQTTVLALNSIFERLYSASRSLRDVSEVTLPPRTFYSPPEPGIGWGPFGLVARWLMRTKSFALTLITGMLGFGLLGSAISTFVRTGEDRIQQSAFTGEIASMVIRGLSAAVVVFLSVKGGLAIFSTGDSEPNAYVLFFTCLVGAVFSEDVWRWARGKFIENLDEKDDNGKTYQNKSLCMDTKKRRN